MSDRDALPNQAVVADHGLFADCDGAGVPDDEPAAYHCLGGQLGAQDRL